MLTGIKGLHHVTSVADDAVRNNTFFTDTLGLRRITKIVKLGVPDGHRQRGNAGDRPQLLVVNFLSRAGSRLV